MTERNVLVDLTKIRQFLPIVLAVVFLSVQSPHAQSIILNTGGPTPGGGLFGWTLHISGNDRGALLLTGKMREPGGQVILLYNGVQTFRIRGSGDAAPGGLGTFRNFRRAALNKSGTIVFIADLSSGQEGLFLIESGKTTTIALERNSGDGFSFIDFFEVDIDDSGTVIFTASTEGSGRTIYRYASGAIERALPSDVQLDGEIIHFPQDIKVADRGDIYFVDYRIVGPVTMIAPAGIFRISGEIEKLVDRTSIPSNSPSRIKVGVGGRGFRSFDLMPTGELLLLADVNAENEKISVFIFDGQVLRESPVASLASTRPIGLQSTTEGFLLLSGRTTATSFLKTLYHVTGLRPKPLIEEGFSVGGKVYSQIIGFLASGRVVYVVASTGGENREEIILSLPVN